MKNTTKIIITLVAIFCSLIGLLIGKQTEKEIISVSPIEPYKVVLMKRGKDIQKTYHYKQP